MNQDLPLIDYPALLWRDGYTYLAASHLELCAHPGNMFADTVRRARLGEWHLVDAKGRCFDISDWRKIRQFGGIKGFGLRLLGSVFAAPVLTHETSLSLPEFKKKLISAVRSRYRHDFDKSVAKQTIKKLETAESYEAAIEALPKL